MSIPTWGTDKRLILGFLLSHLLLFLTFHDKSIFWYIFTAAMLFLISYSIFHEAIENETSLITYLSLGILSGVVLFTIFFAGSWLIHTLNLPFSNEIAKLYKQLSPTMLWHYIVLFLVIIPGEEVFWRGFIQKRIQKGASTGTAVLVSSVLYASAHLYSGSVMLPLAALVSGLFWGYLYTWKKSLPLVIVSHIVFDLFLFIISPLN
ncbi:CPBP family intramembrane metalloprotease [Robertmurraya yapensis]|uniref:CPBP family intramembrane metalloprotease n=2 Tax=Bacillaceae TaxID=186817 RepID=A0A431WA46_9BACI|nr:CPBP family intramembrane glutamic endopeptidase [Bacillus yapensis]RTR32350.1 CPBP family intramembrane metalloprotease [Bacillus yapensis]TKS96544.1 CPBP family intramembrane metalloprotease [Bacillus yapensis]